jgi:hypothetical protein
VTATATTRVPQPLAVDGVVYNDVGSRTLFVRLPDAASGHARSLWRQAHQALLRAEQSGWAANGAPPLYAHGKSNIAHGLPGEAATLKFHFYPGESAYAELVASRACPRLFCLIARRASS